MADGLSVAASAIGIATAALQTVQFLSSTINNIKDVPDNIKNINLDLKAVQVSLSELETASPGDGSQISNNILVKLAVDNCEVACKEFQTLLNRWMKHSTEEKTFWMDRWKVGLFGQDRINTFQGRLRDCKGTLTMALSISSNRMLIQQEHISKGEREMRLQKSEDAIQQHILKAEGERVAIEEHQRQLLAASAQRDEEAECSRKELLSEIEKLKASNDTFRKMCEEALSKTSSMRATQKIQGVKALNDGTALAGFINVEDEAKIDQDISDITADKGIAIVGVVKADLSGLFRR